MIHVAEWTGPGADWDAFVAAAPDSTVMHLWGWKAALERAYGLHTTYLAAIEGDDVRGVLPLVEVRRQLVSMPFMDYGGVCVAGHDKAEQALVTAAARLAERRGRALHLRHHVPREIPLPCWLGKVTMLLDLPASEEQAWRRLPPERRNRIRKGQKAGVTATFHGADGHGDFYAVFAENMRDLGSPVHSQRFFREVLQALDRHCRIIVVRTPDGRPIGAGLMLIHRGMISLPWVSSLRRFFDRCPNQVLYWEVIRYGIAHQHTILDFGRSSPDSGTFEAKRQWGAEPVQLHWHHLPADAPPSGPDRERWTWVLEGWKRLPVPVANLLGPWIRRRIAN